MRPDCGAETGGAVRRLAGRVSSNC